MALADVIKRGREHYSTRQIAAYMGVTPQTVCNWQNHPELLERGTFDADRLARYLGVPKEALFSESGRK